jgi:hypothetical protein
MKKDSNRYVPSRENILLHKELGAPQLRSECPCFTWLPFFVMPPQALPSAARYPPVELLQKSLVLDPDPQPMISVCSALMLSATPPLRRQAPETIPSDNTRSNKMVDKLLLCRGQISYMKDVECWEVPPNWRQPLELALDVGHPSQAGVVLPVVYTPAGSASTTVLLALLLAMIVAQTPTISMMNSARISLHCGSRTCGSSKNGAGWRTASQSRVCGLLSCACMKCVARWLCMYITCPVDMHACTHAKLRYLRVHMLCAACTASSDMACMLFSRAAAALHHHAHSACKQGMIMR